MPGINSTESRKVSLLPERCGITQSDKIIRSQSFTQLLHYTSTVQAHKNSKKQKTAYLWQWIEY